jgi:hypothetical protein
MKTSQFLLIASLAASAVFLPGCANVNSAKNAQPVAQHQMVADKRITTDSALTGRLGILGVNTGGTSAGYLRVQVAVQNTTRSAETFTHDIEWLDDSGTLILTSPSLPRALESKEISEIVAISPTPRARDFRIKFLAVPGNQP